MLPQWQVSQHNLQLMFQNSGIIRTCEEMSINYTQVCVLTVLYGLQTVFPPLLAYFSAMQEQLTMCFLTRPVCCTGAFPLLSCLWQSSASVFAAGVRHVLNAFGVLIFVHERECGVVHIPSVKPALNISLNDVPFQGVLSRVVSFAQLLSISLASWWTRWSMFWLMLRESVHSFLSCFTSFSWGGTIILHFLKSFVTFTVYGTRDVQFAFVVGRLGRPIHEIKRQTNCSFGRPCVHELWNEKKICKRTSLSDVAIWLCKWCDIVHCGHSTCTPYFFSDVAACCLLPCFWLHMTPWCSMTPFFLAHRNAREGYAVNHSGHIFYWDSVRNLRQLWRKYAYIYVCFFFF